MRPEADKLIAGLSAAAFPAVRAQVKDVLDVLFPEQIQLPLLAQT